MSRLHRIARLLAIVLLACSGSTLAQAQEDSPQARTARAMAAYEAKDYATCASLLTALVNDPALKPSSTVAYNAACCQSLAGNPGQALALLDRASSLGMLALANVEADADLAAARALPGWPAMRKTLAAREDARLAGINRELRDELLARQTKDQDIRTRAMAAAQPLAKPLLDEWTRIDHENTEWMKTALAKHGWPGKSLVGEDGANAAWLLVQHADQDKPFQHQAITLLEAAVKTGEASGQQLAYLTDRVLTGEGKPQRYGTQFHQVDGKMVPMAIEDPARVDERRAAVGMGTLAEYTAIIEANYKRTPAADK